MTLPPELLAPLSHVAERSGFSLAAVHWYPHVTSTNDVALVLAGREAPEWTVIVADAQTAGRGRHGRVWQSPPGAGVYLSVVLRPTPRAIELLTLAAGVAAADGLRAATGARVALKWPNDLYLGGRKVGGILAEAGASASGVQHVALGIGINVASGPITPDVALRATSLESELGRSVDRGLVLAESLAWLRIWYERLARGDGTAVLAAWRRHASGFLGRRVEWHDAEGARDGTAEDVDDSGALVVRTDRGRVRIVAGEVRWI